MQNAMSVTTVEGLPVSAACMIAAPRPDLAGVQVRMRGTDAIYLIDPDGFRRFVPFPLTFINLFEDSSVLQTMVLDSIAGIADGPAFDEGAVLLRGRSCENIYLLDRGRKRLITSRQIMEKYRFNEEAVVAIPRLVLDAIPEGQIWE